METVAAFVIGVLAFNSLFEMHVLLALGHGLESRALSILYLRCPSAPLAAAVSLLTAFQFSI